MNGLPILRKSLKQQTSVSIDATYTDGSNYQGIVGKLTSDFVALQQIVNLGFDGYVLIATQKAGNVEAGSVGKATDRVLAHTGEIKKLRYPVWLSSCETWQDVFAYLKRRKVWPSVEIVEKKHSWFLIGRILEVEELGAYIQHYDGNGKWEKEPYPVAFKNLHQLMFGDTYGRNFNSYMRSLPVPKVVPPNGPSGKATKRLVVVT